MDDKSTLARSQADAGPGQPISPRATRTRLARLFVISAVVISAAIILGTAAIISSLRNHALEEAKGQVENVAFMLAEQTDRSLQAVELLAENIIGRIRRLDVTSTAEMERRLAGLDAYTLLKDTISGLPFVESVSIIGARGDSINSSRAWPPRKLNLADRDYYKALASDPKLTSYLSAPVRRRSDQTRAIFLARKLAGPNDEFIGLVLTGLQLSSFEEQFGAVATGEGVEIAFVRSDDTLLAHYPRPSAAVERQDDQGRLFDETAWSPRQDDTHVSAKRSLSHFPASISVSTPKATALAGWRTEALYLSGAAALLVMMIGGITYFMLREFGSYAQVVRARTQQLKAEAARQVHEVAKQQLDAAIDNMPQGLVMFDAASRLVVCNKRYVEMYGFSPEVAVPGRKLRDIIAYRIEKGGLSANPDEIATKVLMLVAKGKPWKSVSELKNGKLIDIMTHPMVGGGWVATHDDVSDQRRADRHLQRTQKFLASVIENVPTAVTVKDAKNLRYLLVNKAAEKFFGLLRSEIVGKTTYDLFPLASAEMIVSHDRQLLESKQEVFIDEHPIHTPAGQHRLIVARRLPIQDENGEPQYLLSLIDDVTDRKQAERKMAHIREHDALTGLPNRTGLAKHLGTKLDLAKRVNVSFALLAIDLDRLTVVNDVYGQAIGDGLLREISRRLRASSEGHFLAHLGSDEFVLTADGPQPATAEQLCDRLLAAMAKKFQIDGHQLAANLSIGAAIFPTDGTDATTLMGNANAALHRAKTEGRGTYRFFESNQDQQLRDRRALHHDLLGATERDEFVMHYQPQARSNGEVIGFEALVRWNHPTRGIVTPAEFIPLAEESGQIQAIGEWTLRTACREAASWSRPLHVAVNVSPAQLHQGDLVKLVHAILLETGLPANRLEIEMTESSLVGDFPRAVSILRRLKALGVAIAMDDFGTGYSSLSYLRAFPFDKIKIDRSFVTDLDEDPQAEAMLRGIIDLAHGLKLPVLAEGVETSDQLALLRKAACDEVQGYLIGRPLPIAHYAHVVSPTEAVKLHPALAS